MRKDGISREGTGVENNVTAMRVDEQIAVLEADGAITLVDLVLGEWLWEGDGKSHGAAVALRFVCCAF